MSIAVFADIKRREVVMKKKGYILVLICLFSCVVDVNAMRRGGGRGGRGRVGGMRVGGRRGGGRIGRGRVGGRVGFGFGGRRGAFRGGRRFGGGFRGRRGFGFGRPYRHRWWYGYPYYGGYGRPYTYSYPEYVYVQRDDSKIRRDIREMQEAIGALENQLYRIKDLSKSKPKDKSRDIEIEEMQEKIESLKKLQGKLEKSLK